MKSWKEIAPGVALQTCEAVLKPPLCVLQIASLLHAVSFKKRKEQIIKWKAEPRIQENEEPAVGFQKQTTHGHRSFVLSF